MANNKTKLILTLNLFSKRLVIKISTLFGYLLKFCQETLSKTGAKVFYYEFYVEVNSYARLTFKDEYCASRI